MPIVAAESRPYECSLRFTRVAHIFKRLKSCAIRLQNGSIY